MKRGVVPCCAALLTIAGVTIGACGGSSGDVVVQVGRTAIRSSTLDHWARIKVSSPGEPASASPKLRALGFLIWSARTIGQAGDLGVEISDKQVRVLLEELEGDWAAGYKGGLIPREAELQQQLQARGETIPDRRWLTRLYLLEGKVEQAQTVQAEARISPAQVLAYYRSHRGRFVVPERRDIAAIMTWREATARQAKREIEAGKSLASVAERFNEQPSEGGIRIGLTRASGKKRYERDFFAARPHVLIGPLKELMYYLFEVTRIVPSRQQSLGEVDGAVRRKLIRGKLRGLLTGVVDASLRRWQASTRCAAGYIVPGCGNRKL